MPPSKKIGYFGLIIFLATLAIYLFVNRSYILVPKYLGNLHMHTLCSDGKNTYEEMVQSAIQNNLSFIAVTDHWYCEEIIKACKEEKRILCFPGKEISSPGRHLLAINISKDIDSDLPLVKQVEEIHLQGGIAIAAHPNAKEFYYKDEELKDSGIDAQECTSDSKERRFLPCVWDSDAHSSQYVAWQFNSCIIPINNLENLKRAIFTGKCSQAASLSSFSVQKDNVIKN